MKKCLYFIALMFGFKAFSTENVEVFYPKSLKSSAMGGTTQIFGNSQDKVIYSPAALSFLPSYNFIFGVGIGTNNLKALSLISSIISGAGKQDETGFDQLLADNGPLNLEPGINIVPAFKYFGFGICLNPKVILGNEKINDSNNHFMTAKSSLIIPLSFSFTLMEDISIGASIKNLPVILEFSEKIKFKCHP